jgi:hypothetical protein
VRADRERGGTTTIKWIAVRDAVARLITEVSSGRLNPRVAAGLVPLMSLHLRAIEVADLEPRLK